MQQINSLTASTILEDEIFCEIFDTDDEIYKARLLLTLTDRAKELGVKAKFEVMVQAYKKVKAKYDRDNVSPSPLNQMEYDGMTHFSGDYPSMCCGMWQADAGGIKMFTPFGEKTACSHPILPIQLLTNAETGYVKVKIAFCLKRKWKEIITDKETISAASKIIGLAKYGIRVTSENAKALVQYLSDIEAYNEEVIIEQVSTSKLGWINSVFMPYNDGVLFDGDENFKSTFESITECGSYETWLELMRKVRKGNRFEPRLYLTGAFASPLLYKLNALPFIINLFGETGKGKTVALMIATSVWANPEEGKYFVKANGTAASIEIRLDFLNHLPLMIDDLAQIQSRLKDDFSEYVYNLCNGGGKDRATQSLGLQRQRHWKNIIITNSERSLINETMQGGAINRIVEFEMEEGYIFNNGNEVVDIVKNNYGFAGKEFIEVIEDIGADAIKEMQHDFLKQILDRAKELGVEKEEKQTLPMSIMLTADKLATDYIFKDGIYLDLNTCVDMLKSKGEISENDRAYDYILSEVAIHTNNFVPDDRGQYKGDVWGTIENGYAIIQNNIFNKMCDNGGFSRKGFLSWAEKRELIQCSGGKTTKTKRMDGSTPRCVWLKMEMNESAITDEEEVPFK